MKKTSLILTAVYAIGLCGCATVQNTNVSGDRNTVAPNQIVEGNKTTVNANVNINLPFPGRGWTVWGSGLTASPEGNTVTLDGTVNTAGYASALLDKNLRNKTIGLAVRNAPDSNFNDGRMIKITVNNDDRLVKPLNVSEFFYGEYVPSDYEWIEFVLPSDFDGKLGFVFTQAKLNKLKITAYHN